MHRHYSNSFTDEQKQASINLFLGVHRPQNHPSLSVLDCDSFLHHAPLHLDFHSGEWWERPLQVFEDTARALRSLPLGAAQATDERRRGGSFECKRRAAVDVVVVAVAQAKGHGRTATPPGAGRP